MFLCPRCHERLARTPTPAGLVYVCGRCHGRAAGLPVVRKSVSPATYRQLWAQAIKGTAGGATPCVVCGRPMIELSVPLSDQQILVDLCKGCQFAWFDARELDRLPRHPTAAEVQAQLPDRVRVQIVAFETQSQSRRSQILEATEPTEGSLVPKEGWHWIPGLFGMPVECNPSRVRAMPWVTWGLGLALAIVFAVSYPHLRETIRTFGLIPDQLARYGGLTLVTAFFLHGGFLHLIGNSYFLAVFGDNVEDYLGRWRYVALLVAATMAGHFAHILGEPRSSVPCIGASGGISGLLAFYALRFPQARVGLLHRIMWFYVPVWGALVLWILLQCVGAAMQIAGFSNVSALAHLGGATAGLAFWLVWRDGAARPAGVVEHGLEAD